MSIDQKGPVARRANSLSDPDLGKGPDGATDPDDHSIVVGTGHEQLAIEVHGLTKRFGETVAVAGIDFSVAQGEIFAFLGPNGAGKSTTIKMLCTLARPTSGQATVAGYDVATRAKAVRRHIGLVFQEQTLDNQLTGEENLRFHAVLYGIPHEQVEPRIAKVLNLVALSERRKDIVSTYSGGMARRLEIARGMLHAPKVLFLDEPTVGLDPQTRALVWDDLHRMQQSEGMTVFLTTHYMDEAEFAHRIAIVDHGSIIALNTPEGLKASVGEDTVNLETADDTTALASLQKAGYQVKSTAEGLTVSVADADAAVGPIVMAAGVPVRTLRAHHPSLDDVFLHFTGRQIREEHGEAVPMMARAHGARAH
jgi:ABC-2 type transport system ATP-binding protein